MKWRWSLRLRFLLLLVILLLAIFVAITAIIVGRSAATLRDSLVNQSKSFAALATQPIGNSFLLYRNSGTIRIQQEIDSFTSLDPSINQVEIVDSQGNLQYSRVSGHNISVAETAAQSLDPTYVYDAAGQLTTIVQPYVESYGIHRYTIVYGISYDALNQSITSIVATIIMLSLVILLVSLVLWYVLINQLFLRPVAQMSRVALQISKGDLSRAIKIDRNDEIGDLADAVDTMASSLKADIAKLKEVDELKSEFLMITSHNLRTPITVMKAYLEQIASLKPPTKIADLLKPVGVNVARLGGFAEDVLTISTMEAGQNILHQEPTEMATVLQGIAADFAAMAEEKKLQFSAAIETASWVNLSKPHFRSSLWNLLDNAYKFTAEGGAVALTARTVTDSAKGERLEISVRDSGTGIAAAEIPKLFTKFHRATDIMAYNYEGTGIGLYIAKLIVEQHGGTIGVESTEGKGSCFTISLPTIPKPAQAG